jgi:hypothetical protein
MQMKMSSALELNSKISKHKNLARCARRYTEVQTHYSYIHRETQVRKRHIPRGRLVPSRNTNKREREREQRFISIKNKKIHIRATRSFTRECSLGVQGAAAEKMISPTRAHCAPNIMCASCCRGYVIFV